MHRLFSLLVSAFIATSAFAADDNTSQHFTLGADIGWCTEYEHDGKKFFNYQGEERECTALMKELGCDAIRIRVWVDPEGFGKGRWCNLDDVLEKCRRAKALGMDIMIDFHYSDWWADPQKQNIPKSWEGHKYKQMLVDLKNHTIQVLQTLKDKGYTIKWVQVGNEISNGFLWSVEMDPQTGWEKKDAEGKTIMTKHMAHLPEDAKQFAGFFAAGYDAVKSVMPETQVIVHFDNGFDNDLYTRNLDILQQYGAKWDIIGMSLYPYWSIEGGREPQAQKTIIDCIRNINKLYTKYQTPSMIVETGYEVDMQNTWKMQLGRAQLKSLINKSLNETEGHCLGVFYWEPECRPSQYKLGAFDEEGKPTEIMRAMTLHKLLSTKDSQLSTLDSRLSTNYDRPLLKIETTEGDIIVELYNETPIHRDNFLRLVKEGALEKTLFHRVIKDFMIQGGDPETKNAPATSLENPAPEVGNNDYPTETGEKSIPAEIRFPQYYHKRGALAAAREPDSDNPQFRSSSSQFYIVWGRSPAIAGKHPYVDKLPFYDYEAGTMYAKSDRKSVYQPTPAGTPWLDGGYTVFGEVVEGLDVVDKIQQSETDPKDRPLKDVRILKVKVIE